jgi:hypothetical protein
VVREVENRASRRGVVAADRNRSTERDKRAAAIADGEADHLGKFASKRSLAALGRLARQDVIFEHEVVGDCGWQNRQIGYFGREGGAEKAGLR